MKRLSSLRLVSGVLCAWLLLDCSGIKKSTRTAETVSIASDKSESHTIDSHRYVDTTVTQRGRITITEIEFYHPTDCTHTANNASGVTLPQIGSVAGAIKSIRQTTIEMEIEKKGESGESSSETGAANESVAMVSEIVTQMDVAPAPDPKRWRYIFYIMALGAVVMLYLRRGKAWEWVKRMVVSLKILTKKSNMVK